MKSYVISVSLYTGCYRHIQISAGATLFQLHKAILNAFDFDDDHAHAFFMDNQCWGRGDAYFSMKMDGNERLTKKYKLEKFNFTKGKAFKYVFDFGDEWLFQCKVLRETQEHIDIPCVIRSVGESPEQYPELGDAWDDEEWDDEDEWDEEEDPISQEELDALYAMIPLKKKVIQDIQQYFDAASRFYGLITLDKLYDIYTSQNPPVSKEAFFMVASVSAQEEHQYVINLCGQLSETDIVGNLSALEVAAEYLFYEDNTREYDALRRKQKDKPYKILPKKEFLRYADPYGHTVTAEHKALLDFLTPKKDALTPPPQVMCHAIRNFLMLDAKTGDIVRYMADFGLHVDRKTELLEFDALIQALDRRTPKHAHRGHTPEEMFAISKQGQKLAEKNAPENQLSMFDEPAPAPQLTLVKNPARNAPCGSGRKYKNCCGKHT